jgi:hypothetical protein
MTTLINITALEEQFDMNEGKQRFPTAVQNIILKVSLI